MHRISLVQNTLIYCDILYQKMKFLDVTRMYTPHIGETLQALTRNYQVQQLYVNWLSKVVALLFRALASWLRLAERKGSRPTLSYIFVSVQFTLFALFLCNYCHLHKSIIKMSRSRKQRKPRFQHTLMNKTSYQSAMLGWFHSLEKKREYCI